MLCPQRAYLSASVTPTLRGAVLVCVCVCVWDGPLRLQTQRVEVGQEVAVGAVRLHQPQQLGILTAISDLGRRVCMCVYVYVCVCVCGITLC
jgi:hypothetical protein